MGAVDTAWDAGVPYLQLVVGFLGLVKLLHTYLDIRQLKALSPSKPPAAIAHLFKDSYKASQAYSIDKWWFSFWQGLFGSIENVAFLGFGFMPWLWDHTGRFTRQHVPGSWSTGMKLELAHTVVFALATTLFNTLEGLPWDYYKQFVLEEKHGFNKMTRRLFFMDALKSVIMLIVLVPLITVGVTYILITAGPWMPVLLWLFVVVLMLVMVTVYPTVIAPLFNKYEHLPEGELRTQIEFLAGRVRFPLTKLYKVDGSKRSNHSNAYMYGFFKNKRIVLFDTLINQCSTEEVLAVLAHELGHWKLGHTIKNLLIAQVQLLVQFSLFALVRNSHALYSSFGFVRQQPAFVSLLLYMNISAPLDEIIGLTMNMLSRKFEFEADAFAVSLGHAAQLKEGLIVLQQENKSALRVDPWYSAYHNSHPHLIERLEAIDRASKKVE